jgi:uncharacterized protein YbaA (DUF1428 family)
MAYVDGFLLTVPTKNVAAYLRMSRKAGKIWMDHGALEYRECVGDDMKQQKGLKVSFPKTLKAKPSETVIFSWIVYKSRAQRDKVLKAVMADTRMKTPMDMPFDATRMHYGGFTIGVDLKPPARSGRSR